MAGQAAAHNWAEVVQELLEGLARVDEAICLGSFEGLEVQIRGRVVENQIDGNVLKEHPGLSPQQLGQPVAIHGLSGGIHEQHLGLVPGIPGQGLQGILGLEDMVPRPLESRAKAFNEVAVSGDGQEVHGGPVLGAPC